MIGFMKLHEDAIVPTKAHKEDAGFDLYALRSVRIKPHESATISTGIAWDGMKLVTETHTPVMIVKSRSGLAVKHDIESSNAGVIDAAYTGDIKVKLYNNSKHTYVVHKGDRIAQGVIFMLPLLEAQEVFEIGETDRGDNGFGSTGR
jgi:dUTP pyrophosphatase